MVSSYIFFPFQGLWQLTSINSWPVNCFSHIAEVQAINFELGLLADNICKIKTSVQKSNPQLMSHLHTISSARYMRISNLSDMYISSIKYVFQTIVHHNLLFSHLK